MKKTIIALVSVFACILSPVAFAQADPGLLAKFLDQAKSAGDNQLDGIGSELTDKIKSFGASLGSNPAVTGKLDDMLKSLTGGEDSAALGSAYKLVTAAKFTPEQTDLAKQVGNVASAFVVQKNFASLEGAQGDVATVVGSLRAGNLTSAIPPLKNIAGNNHLTDQQKKLVGVLTDKYAPGLKKAAGALEGIKKLPGF